MLSGSSNYMIFKDYSYFILDGEPREGQTLEEVRNLLLAELDKIKSGEFDDWMIPAVLKNNKLTDYCSKSCSCNSKVKNKKRIQNYIYQCT